MARYLKTLAQFIESTIAAFSLNRYTIYTVALNDFNMEKLT